MPVYYLDEAFHDAVAAATGNQSIVMLMDQLHDLLGESRGERLLTISGQKRQITGGIT